MSPVLEIAPPPAVRPLEATPRDDSVGASEGGAGWTMASLAAGALTPFTVSLVGEMPVGELVLMAVCAWSVFLLAMTRRWPSPLWRGGWFAAFMAFQASALAAYVVSDFYRGSAPNDMMRGWGRMVFLAVNLVAMATLLGRDARNLLWFVGGLQLGEVAAAVVHGPLFGDWWKFGVGIPVTFTVLGLAGCAGAWVSAAVAAGLCLLNFAMDFRSVGALCMLVAAMLAVQAFPRRVRLWLVPVGAMLALVAVAVVYQRSQATMEGGRAGRSDIDRSSMLQAAWEGFAESPFVGQGSWFSRSKVIDNYLYIRDAAAREARVGGFAGPNEETEGVALHSQILVALAEGGLFGAAFFFAYGAGLIWALCDQVLGRAFDRWSAVRLFLLVLAFFHLFMSPFSGAHRVHIALAAGLVMLMAWERRPEIEADAAGEEVRA